MDKLQAERKKMLIRDVFGRSGRYLAQDLN
jgi:hypothetical protein